MDRCVGAAARLVGSERKDLAVLALARSAPVSDLAARHGVSRKFVYQQTYKAQAALDDAFTATTRDDAALFDLTVSRPWLRQVIVGLALICHSSYRGIVAFLRDLLGVTISVGTVHDVLQSATQQAGVINCQQDLSAIRVGLHDEIFHAGKPVLAGVDARSTYCYLLAAEPHRDADTWGVHLLDAARQGLSPEYTIADAGQGLRAGTKGRPGATRRAMAMCFTSSANAKASPTRCRALPRAPPRGARRCRPSWTAPVSRIQTTDLPLNWRWRDKLKRKRSWTGPRHPNAHAVAEP